MKWGLRNRLRNRLVKGIDGKPWLFDTKEEAEGKIGDMLKKFRKNAAETLSGVYEVVEVRDDGTIVRNLE